MTMRLHRDRAVANATGMNTYPSISSFTRRLMSAALVALVLSFASNDTCRGQASRLARHSDPCCKIADVPGIVWYGSAPSMTAERLAAYCAPILWFSPDEPLLEDAIGKGIRIPDPFPFEDSTGAPVVYFRVRRVISKPDAAGPAYIPDADDRGRSVIDLRYVKLIDLDFFFYYRSEEGFGGHQHDVESVEMKIVFGSREDCDPCRYGVIVARTNGKAHGIRWYDNTLETDVYTVHPLTILVEEGKHASCTDKNGDGWFTPGYDVNRRVNDAWGVRDVIRSGTLGSGGFQSWMAKFRSPDTRVFPPLPEDSPLRASHTRDGAYAPDNAVYELRPFPRAELAREDPKLVPFIADKGNPDWPVVEEGNEFVKMRDFVRDESFVKSLSVAYRYDGSHGVAFVFPLFIVRNFEDPVAGGWIVNCIHLSDKQLGQERGDFSWQALYTTSASRWIDGYIAAGAQWHDDGTSTKSFLVTETGVKFRFDLAHTGFKFLTKLGTDFWGIRMGINYRGANAWSFDHIGYAFEIGAGTW
jgi:hypothetical protein